MQSFQVKSKNNNLNLILLVLVMLSFNTILSAQWVLRSGDGRPSGALPTIYMVPGQTVPVTIFNPLTVNLVYNSINANSPIPILGNASISNWSANSPITFNVTIPNNIPLNQINYYIVINSVSSPATFKQKAGIVIRVLPCPNCPVQAAPNPTPYLPTSNRGSGN